MDNPNENVQSPSTSPISRLHADILWLIFLRNTDVQGLLTSFGNIFRRRSTEDHDTALDTTLISARVCQHWRSLLLNWPVLWGRVLLLNRLHRLGKKGREEIMRRTGTAPLYLIGDVTYAPQFVDEFVAPLLKANWERVQKIHIRADKPVIHRESIWNTFTRNAPMLEWFLFESAARPQHRAIPEDLVVDLFGDFAPQLRIFRCDTITSTLPGGHWYNNLQEFHLTSTDLQLSSVLDIIKQIPLLEYLHLENLPGEDDVASAGSDSIDLPRLVGLSLDIPFLWALVFARRIKPANNCTLSFRPILIDSLKQQHIAEMMEILERYADAYFPFCNVFSVEITITKGEFSFSVSDAEHISSRGRVQHDLSIQQFNFAIHLNFPMSAVYDSDIDCSSFLVPFLRHDLSNIQTLDLEIAQLNADSWDNIRPIIVSLKGVKTLRIGTSISTLKVLEKYHVDETQTLFPTLRNLHVEADDWELKSYEFEPIFSSFISRGRRANTSFLEVLDLGSSPKGDWSFLDDVGELKVVWSGYMDFEYICGSGSPWELTFSDSEIEDDSMEELAAAIGFPIRRQRRW